MGRQRERIERIEALRGLLVRLCAPDLTLAEARVVRSRLTDLLAWGDYSNDEGQPASPSPDHQYYGLERRLDEDWPLKTSGLALG